MKCLFCNTVSKCKELPLCKKCIVTLAETEEKLTCPFESIKCCSAKAKKMLIHRLEGKIFHVTDVKGFLGITATGKIEPNISGKFGNNWGKKSYFASRGCISVCDLHNHKKSKKRCEAIRKYNFHDLSCNKGLSYLMVLQADLFADTITWDIWKQDREGEEDVVPYLESGYPGEIPLSKLDSVVRVYIEDHFYYVY